MRVAATVWVAAEAVAVAAVEVVVVVAAVNTLFKLPRKKRGGMYTSDSRWGVVAPRGGLLIIH